MLQDLLLWKVGKWIEGKLSQSLQRDVTVYSTFIIERYCYMMRDSRLPCKEYSRRMFRFSHLLIIFIFFVQKSFLTKNHFHTAEINLTTEGPLYTCLVEYDMTMWFLFYFLFSVAGANPTEPVESEKGKTALHIAAAKGHMDILLLLVYKVC